jgi:hypothetical protein
VRATGESRWLGRGPLSDADQPKSDADAAEVRRPESLWLVTDSDAEKKGTNWVGRWDSDVCNCWTRDKLASRA